MKRSEQATTTPSDVESPPKRGKKQEPFLLVTIAAHSVAYRSEDAWYYLRKQRPYDWLVESFKSSPHYIYLPNEADPGDPQQVEMMYHRFTSGFPTRESALAACKHIYDLEANWDIDHFQDLEQVEHVVMTRDEYEAAERGDLIETENEINFSPFAKFFS